MMTSVCMCTTLILPDGLVDAARAAARFFVEDGNGRLCIERGDPPQTARGIEGDVRKSECPARPRQSSRPAQGVDFVIVVDTSVWISALCVPKSPDAETLRGLLDADQVLLPVSVRSELLMGITGATRKQLAERLGALSLLYTTDETWRTLDSWTERASRRGQLFSLGDLIVGILASEVGALVWSLDADFGRMEKLDLVRLYG